MKHPLISVIIVNYNGRKWLPGCLTSVLRQTYPNFEVIVVDNASTDDSVKYIAGNFPKLKLVINSSNVGFASGNNIGYSHSKGRFIILLNNDTVVPTNYLVNFYKAFQEIPNLGIAQSKIFHMNNNHRIDSCGSFWTFTTWQYYLGNGKIDNLPIYNFPQPIFSVKGASMMISRKVIDKIGFFDDDFWCYYEETDLCHRAWIAGFQCWYWPKTHIYHAVGSTSTIFPNSYIQFHNYKNKLHSYLKNFESPTLVSVIPAFIIWSIIISGMWLCLMKFDNIISLVRAFLWNTINLHHVWSKRKLVQKIRVKSDKEIFKLVKKEPNMSYFFYLLIGRLDQYTDKLSIADVQRYN